MNRIKYLDGLKGLCCYLVFLRHFCNVGFALQMNAVNLFSDCFSGIMCVSLFIIISSFCICISCENNINKIGNIQNVVLKRYFRIAIPASFFILLSYVASSLGICYNVEAGKITENSFLLNLYTSTSHLIILKDILLSPLGKCLTWLPQGWMLIFVFLGSFISIIFYLGTEHIKSNKVYLVCSFFFLLSFFIDCYYACIIFGFCLFRYLKGNSKNSVVITIASCLGYGILFYVYHNRILRYDEEVVKSILAFFLITAVVHSAHLRKFLENKIFLWLGKISFSLYLIHWLVITSVSSFIFTEFQSIDGLWLGIINLTITTVVLLFVSWICQKYIEQGIAKTIENKILSFLVK